MPSFARLEASKCQTLQGLTDPVTDSLGAELRVARTEFVLDGVTNRGEIEVTEVLPLTSTSAIPYVLSFGLGHIPPMYGAPVDFISRTPPDQDSFWRCHERSARDD